MVRSYLDRLSITAPMIELYVVALDLQLWRHYFLLYSDHEALKVFAWQT